MILNNQDNHGETLQKFTMPVIKQDNYTAKCITPQKFSKSALK